MTQIIAQPVEQAGPGCACAPSAKTATNPEREGVLPKLPGMTMPRRRLLSAGEGFLGALGGGDFAARRTLEPVVPPASLASLEIARVRAGWAHAAAVTRCGRLFVWGRPFDFATVMRLNRLHGMWPPLASLVNRTAAALGARDDGGAESVVSAGRRAPADGGARRPTARPPSTSRAARG